MDSFSYAMERFKTFYGVCLREEARDRFLDLEEKYGTSEVIESINIATETYDNPITAASKIPGILFNRSKIRNSFFEGD